MSNLIKATKTTALVASINPEEKLTPAIQEALHGSLAAFAAQRNVSDADRAANLRSFKFAMAGFHEALVVYVLKHLMLKNPRNPFPFTAQDLYEALKREQKAWFNHVAEELDEGRCGPQEGARTYGRFGGPILTPACLIPDDLVRKLIRDYEEQIEDRLKHRREIARAYSNLPRDTFSEATWVWIAAFVEKQKEYEGRVKKDEEEWRKKFEARGWDYIRPSQFYYT